MSVVKKCPPISLALLDYLEHMFPDETVDPSKKDPSVEFGKAKVVRHLKAQRSEQEAVTYVRTRENTDP